MGEIHAHRGRLVEQGIGAIGTGGEQLGADTQRLLRRMADAEHPLVATQAAHAPPHLIGECLQAEITVGRRQGARDRIRRSRRPLHGEERRDRFGESPCEEVLVAAMRDERRSPPDEPRGEVEAVDCVEEKQRPDALVEIRARATEGLQGLRLGEECRQVGIAAEAVHGPVAGLRVGGGDDGDEATGTHGERAS